MTQDLDALPLPEPIAILHTGDDFGDERDDPELEFNSFNAAADFCLSKLAKTKVGLHSDDALRAYGQRCYELAKREALEGRAPVGEIFLGTDDKPVPKLYAKHSDLPAGTKLYTSPPPKSDEARDAERYRWLLRNYLRFSLQDEALKHGSLDAAIDAALAAQQKGKK